MSEPAIIRPDKQTFLAEENPFEAMMERFDHAAKLLNLDRGLYKVLRNPEKQIIVSVPILRDSGEVEVYTGYRVLISYAVFCLKKKNIIYDLDQDSAGQKAGAEIRAGLETRDVK